jgi:hypothetical protein
MLCPPLCSANMSNRQTTGRVTLLRRFATSPKRGIVPVRSWGMALTRPLKAERRD